MRKKLIVLTPLPQFCLGRKDLTRFYRIGETISIRPLRRRLRRTLLNCAKEKNTTDDLLMLLNESELVFIAEVPARRRKGTQENIILPLLYSEIASEILNRLHNCFLLFGWVPAPIFMPCWFSGKASVNYANITDLVILNPGWKYIDQFTNIDWRSPTTEPVDIGLCLFGVHSYWEKLSRLCQVDQLVKIFTNPNKEKGLMESAKEYSIIKAEELIRAKYGPDAAIERSPTECLTSDPTTGHDTGKVLISPKQMGRWLIQGLGNAMGKELEKISERLHTNPSKNRLARAFQFFCEAFRLAEPHRFVIFAVCIETLLSTRRTEIVFQLASRLSWLIESEDYRKRRDIFKETTQLYDIRSKIVHGGNFSISEIETGEERLIDLCRRVFYKILSDDRLFNTFFGKDPLVCDDYLDSLTLGIIRE